jgi:hypothetical protein
MYKEENVQGELHVLCLSQAVVAGYHWDRVRLRPASETHHRDRIREYIRQ